MASGKIPVVVAGTGFGCRIQIPALRAAGFEVAGLVGADAGRTLERAELNGVGGAFTDLDEAISRTGAKAVAIATPPHTHGPLTLAAIARGCHVLCEKPFARDAGEAKAMLDAAERARVVHMLGHEFRCDPVRVTFARTIAEGAIGVPKLANFTSLITYMAKASDMPPWWFNEEDGGGWLGATSPHLVDWIRFSLGDFDSLSGGLATLAPQNGEADDTYAFRFRLKTGLEGIVQQAAAASGPPISINRVVGTKGAIWIESRSFSIVEAQGARTHAQEIKIADAEGTRTVPIPADLALPAIPPLSADPRHETTKWKQLVPVELPPYMRLCEAFHAAIEGRAFPYPVPMPTFRDGVASMEVIDAVRTSAAEGGALVRMG
jgi:predicted dehydrogenase